MPERPPTSDEFPVHWPASSRWADNDMFGHLNNAVYYQLFDSAINGWIGGATGRDPLNAPWLAVVAESGCRYFAELRFPDPLTVGLAVARVGTSSVTYRLAVFEAPGPVAAVGHWVHVYLDRSTRRPMPVPAEVRTLLDTARVGDGPGTGGGRAAGASPVDG